MGSEMRRCLLAAVVLLLIPWESAAEIYMYRGRDGTLSFSNAPSKQGYKRYSNPGRPGPVVDRARHGRYDHLILDAGQRHQVDPALVKAVIRAESDFIAHARSPKGALGLMQLMPATARRHRAGSVLDPQQNIEAGTQHLRLLLDTYDGNVRLALAAYNAGGGAVQRYGGIPPYPETVEYLRRVLRFREHYRQRF
jgi:soluble lytic murein transglycosylase-like protein